MRQICWLSWQSGAFQVLGAGVKRSPHIREFARDQVGIGGLAHANCDVHVHWIADQVDLARR